MSLLPNIKQMDQSSWSCYHLEHNSYYYGEVGYLDESAIVHPKDNLQAANNPKNKLVKHGFGIYLLNVNDEISVPQMKYHVSFAQYKGYWDKDEKSGKGSVKYSNGTMYDGTFHEGHYHGTGKMTWPSGDQYDGSWKRSKMDGSGVFRQANGGFVLKGIFKNNYFIDDNVLRNPFMDEQAYAVFKKQRKEILKLKEKQQKLKHGFSTKITYGQLQNTINKSVSNNRVPLVLATKTVECNLQQLVETLGQQQKVNVLDLRKIYMLEGEARWAYRKQVHDMFRKSLKNGEAFIISLDESDTPFKEMFYPDIKEFYQPNGFNHLSWSREQLQQPEIRKKIIGSSDEISPKFKLVVWTKFKVEGNISDDSMRETLQVRFEKIIPFVKVDCVVVAEAAGEE